MGMFDNVIFDCPDCGYKLDVQSKAGYCILDTYSQHSVPVPIAIDIENELVYCEKCDQEFLVKPVQKIIKHIDMELIKK